MDKELKKKYKDVEIRPLNAMDLLSVAKLASKFLKKMAEETKPGSKGKNKGELQQKIQELTKKYEGTDKSLKEVTQEAITEVGGGLSPFELLALALEEAEDIVVPFMASVSNMDEKKFKEMPFDFPLYVVEYLNEKEDLQGFFTRAVSLGKKFSGGGTTQSKKE